jgi:hypothetical protein
MNCPLIGSTRFELINLKTAKALMPFRPPTLLRLLRSGFGTTRKSLALQHFLPESEGQLTCPGRGREDVVDRLLPRPTACHPP